MEIKEIHTKIEKNCPPQYSINEIIPFGYPLREIKIKALVSKSPEKAIQQMYSVMLRAVKIGYHQEPLLVRFLGLNEDDFILNELYTLREKGYLDFISQQWVVTPQGEKFLEDATILKISEEEEFTFYLDCYTNAILSKKNLVPSKQKTHNKLEPKYNFEHKSSEILNNRNQDIQDIYKKENTDSYLIDYADTLLFDKKIDNTYCLIEYIPLNDENEPYIEIRNFDDDFSIEKRLTKLFQEEYPSILYTLSDSDREKLAHFEEKK